jgi:CxxC-x17-CxxC domain-containing protein
MYPAVCDKCGQQCEVPFRPTGEKPVLCNNCFRGNRDYDSRGGGRDNSRGFKPRNFEPRSNDNSKQFTEINAKLDKIIAALKA